MISCLYFEPIKLKKSLRVSEIWLQMVKRVAQAARLALTAVDADRGGLWPRWTLTTVDADRGGRWPWWMPTAADANRGKSRPQCIPTVVDADRGGCQQRWSSTKTSRRYDWIFLVISREPMETFQVFSAWMEDKNSKTTWYEFHIFAAIFRGHARSWSHGTNFEKFLRFVI